MLMMRLADTSVLIESELRLALVNSISLHHHCIFHLFGLLVTTYVYILAATCNTMDNILLALLISMSLDGAILHGNHRSSFLIGDTLVAHASYRIVLM